MNEDCKMVLTHQRLPIELTIKQICLCISILIALMILVFNIGVRVGELLAGKWVEKYKMSVVAKVGRHTFFRP